MRRAFLLLPLLMLAACSEPPRSDRLVESAEFGIFWGGQVQERDEIPFSLDRSKQIQGVRIELAAPAKAPLEVSWELDMPGSTRRARDAQGRRGKGRVVKTGRTEMRQGQDRLDLELPFEPGDPLGTWNVRVSVAGETVVDRPFLVYDAGARKRAKREQREAERAAHQKHE